MSRTQATRLDSNQLLRAHTFGARALIGPIQLASAPLNALTLIWRRADRRSLARLAALCVGSDDELASRRQTMACARLSAHAKSIKGARRSRRHSPTRAEIIRAPKRPRRSSSFAAWPKTCLLACALASTRRRASPLATRATTMVSLIVVCATMLCCRNKLNSLAARTKLDPVRRRRRAMCYVSA